MVIKVKAKSHSYKVVVEKNCLKDAKKYFNLDRKVLVVTDSNIPVEYIKTIRRQCKSSYVYTFLAGEESKNFNVYQEIIAELFKNEFSRKDCIVAIGGGVTGDMAGFAAATYMRGIDFYNVPTSLLAMVDSSIGGKTAIDLKGYKNIIGAFYPPMGVLIDPEVLISLPIRHVYNGLAEVIKMAATFDASLFKYLEDNVEDIFDKIDEVIYRSLLLKKDVVEKDEKEAGLRQVLNFGHTIGHAIETYSKGDLLHGECVAIGMLYVTDKKIRTRLQRLLDIYCLPTSFIGDEHRLIDIIKHDKKANDDKVNVVLVKEIGTFDIVSMTFKELEALL